MVDLTWVWKGRALIILVAFPPKAAGGRGVNVSLTCAGRALKKKHVEILMCRKGGGGEWNFNGQCKLFSLCALCIEVLFLIHSTYIKHKFCQRGSGSILFTLCSCLCLMKLRVLIYDGRLTRNLDSDTIHNQT